MPQVSPNRRRSGSPINKRRVRKSRSRSPNPKKKVGKFSNRRSSSTSSCSGSDSDRSSSSGSSSSGSSSSTSRSSSSARSSTSNDSPKKTKFSNKKPEPSVNANKVDDNSNSNKKTDAVLLKNNPVSNDQLKPKSVTDVRKPSPRRNNSSPKRFSPPPARRVSPRRNDRHGSPYKRHDRISPRRSPRRYERAQSPRRRLSPRRNDRKFSPRRMSPRRPIRNNSPRRNDKSRSPRRQSPVRKSRKEPEPQKSQQINTKISENTSNEHISKPIEEKENVPVSIEQVVEEKIPEKVDSKNSVFVSADDSPANEIKSQEVFRIYVTRLTRNILKAHLQEIFGTYGVVKKVDYPTDKFHPESGKGFAYIEFEPSETCNPAAEAVLHMDGGQIDGQIVGVRISEPESLIPIERVQHRRRSRSPPHVSRRHSKPKSPPLPSRFGSNRRRPPSPRRRNISPTSPQRFRRSPNRHRSHSPPNRRFPRRRTPSPGSPRRVPGNGINSMANINRRPRRNSHSSSRSSSSS